jgi:hypothetical protein
MVRGGGGERKKGERAGSKRLQAFPRDQRRQIQTLDPTPYTQAPSHIKVDPPYPALHTTLDLQL